MCDVAAPRRCPQSFDRDASPRPSYWCDSFTVMRAPASISEWQMATKVHPLNAKRDWARSPRSMIIVPGSSKRSKTASHPGLRYRSLQARACTLTCGGQSKALEIAPRARGSVAHRSRARKRCCATGMKASIHACLRARPRAGNSRVAVVAATERKLRYWARIAPPRRSGARLMRSVPRSTGDLRRYVRA
jgi:hypothetical protein